MTKRRYKPRRKRSATKHAPKVGEPRPPRTISPREDPSAREKVVGLEELRAKLPMLRAYLGDARRRDLAEPDRTMNMMEYERWDEPARGGGSGDE